MTVTNRELHGVDAPLDEEVVLRAGPFEAIFEPARAYLRRVRINGVELVRNVYLHARGADWETVLPTVSNIESKIWADHFELTWHAVHRHSGIDFEWMGTLTGSPSGIYYRCDGLAVHEFKTNRTGLCVLIPREFRGQTADVEHPDGSHSSVVLPTTIAPVEPLREMQTVAVGPIKLTFEGDKFEAEDQRNWTDASFKAYQLRGRREPAYTLQQGEKVMHAVRIEATGSPVLRQLVTAPLPGRVLLGATLANDRDDLSGLPVDFLRVEVPRDDDVGRHLIDHARSAGIALQLVTPRGAVAPTPAGKDTLIEERATPPPQGLSSIWLGAGSFDGFNMGRHEAVGFGGVEVSVTPQIHTFDERSILENAATLADVLGSLSAIAPGAKFGLNIHLKGDGPDPRLQSLFGALWILRSYAAASEFGAAHLTFGSTAEMSHPALSALLRQLTVKHHYETAWSPSNAEVVVLASSSEGEYSYLVGNLLRSPRPIMFGSGGTNVQELTPTGWSVNAGFKSGGSMAPYEIIALTSKSELKIG